MVLERLKQERQESLVKEETKKLKQIKDEVVNCAKCPLQTAEGLPVIGEGSHRAKIVFVGEAPGANEAKTGRPFCGAAGKVLDDLFESIGISRKEIYITNLLKHRPPLNRDPEAKEIRACAFYLERQLEIIKPKIICSLGRHSMYFLFDKFGIESDYISRIHGRAFEAEASFGKINLVAFYHPAVGVYNPHKIPELKKDFKILLDL